MGKQQLLEITVDHWSFSTNFSIWLTKIHFRWPNFLYIYTGTAISILKNLIFKKWLTNFWSLFLALKQYWYVWIPHLSFLSLQGHGDTSGGCRCRVDKKKCHPQCGNCHWQTAHAEHGKCFVDSFLFVNELHSDWIF